MHRAAVGVVGRVDGKLIVEGKVETGRHPHIVVGLRHPLRRVVQAAVPSDEADPAGFQIVAAAASTFR